MKPAPGIVFAGHEPEGWTGEVIPHDEWGLGLGLEDFFRLCEFSQSRMVQVRTSGIH